MNESEIRIYCASIVTPEGLICGEVVLRDSKIHAVEGRPTPPSGALDWSGDVMVAGLVDIHTDNLEKHYQPRPGAAWDAYGAALAHDGQCASAGITTVLDSLSLHGAKDGLDRNAALGPMIEAMDAAAADDALRADHLLHLRCEVTNPELMSALEPHSLHPRLRLLSVMDHTPGQRQIRDIGLFERQLLAEGRSPAEVAEILGPGPSARSAGLAEQNRRQVVELANGLKIPLAAHDDATVEQVEEAARDGCIMSEFPVTLQAARRARELGLTNCMGAPNFVRGGSHSGNLSARECAEHGLLDILASDYVPLSMLRAAFLMIDLLKWPPEKALATVSVNPARSVGLADRGEIAAGQRADLIRVSRGALGWPAPREVWRSGRRVA
jgi:alpha-D-ribose 1-methylphosphonate 5-triphosphate diphosphatase